MQRFAFKIDKSVKARLKNCCRLCGIDNPNQVDILNAAEWIDLTTDDEVPLSRKIIECVGIEVLKNDKMPQRMCALCVDKINDFYEFREMCQATNIQTRKLLNLPDPTKVKVPKKVTIKVDEDAVESILGISGSETKPKTEPVAKTGKKSKKASNATTSTATANPANENRFRGMTKREIEITLELERIKKEEEDELTANVVEPTKAAAGRTKNGKKKRANAKTASMDAAPLLAPKAPNQRERKREMEQKRMEKKRKLDTKTKAPVPKKIKREPGVSCLVCEERFEKISHRDTHLQAMHRPSIADYGCATCHEQFVTLQEITAHNEWHIKNSVQHKCTICGASFPKLLDYQNHLLDCIDPSFVVASEFAGNILCGNCNLEYETQNLYDWHACFIGDNSRCPQCQRVFIKRSVLLKHMFKCTGPPLGNVAPPIAAAKKVGRPKKKSAKGLPKAKNQADIPPQNSFKFEPETIIDQNADGDDDVYNAVDDSYMDTHFADSDNEFDPSNSIITSSGLDDTPNSPAKQSEIDNSTINQAHEEIQTPPSNNGTAASARTNMGLSLLQCHVKLEPLDVASLAVPSISVNPPVAPVIHQVPVIEPPQRPLTVPPLTIRIKKEVIRPGYGDEFDANLAHNIKQERVDETYELAGSSTQKDPQNYSNAHKKSKHRDKQKKLYKKPALLAIKIKQERMEREANDDDEYGQSYPDYSMSSEDYSMPPSDATTANNSPFDTNPLPIITQIHSVIEAGVPASTSSSFNLSLANKPSALSQSTNNLVPFTPIRIKSEFQRPLSPPPNPIDSTLMSQRPDNASDLVATEGLKLSENEQQSHSEYNPGAGEKLNDGQQFNETVDSTMALEGANNDTENQGALLIETDQNEYENNGNEEPTSSMVCDTSSSLHDNVQSTTNIQTDEAVNSTAKSDSKEDFEDSDSQICSSAVNDEPPVPHEMNEKDEPLLPIEPMSDTQDQANAFNKSQAGQKTEENIIHSMYENSLSSETNPNIESTSSSCAVDMDIGDDMVENGKQLAKDPTHVGHDAVATSAEILQTNDEICAVGDAIVSNVTNENSNISPIDFIENANDDSLNFIDQLVHEVADTIIAAHEASDVMATNSAAPIEPTEMPFMASAEFNYNVGCSTENAAENHEPDAPAIEAADKSTLLALSDIPDIDCNLLPVLNDTNEYTSNAGDKDNACSPSVVMDENNESGANATAATDNGCKDIVADDNADTNIQNDVEEPK